MRLKAVGILKGMITFEVLESEVDKVKKGTKLAYKATLFPKVAVGDVISGNFEAGGIPKFKKIPNK
jgi:hypothetical protein